MRIKTIYHSKLIKACALMLLCLSSSIAETYTDYCKIYNPKKGLEYDTHTKITVDFCRYYLKICNEKYNNKCNAKMNGYQGLYNTNPTMAKMHVLYNKDFDSNE